MNSEELEKSMEADENAIRKAPPISSKKCMSQFCPLRESRNKDSLVQIITYNPYLHFQILFPIKKNQGLKKKLLIPGQREKLKHDPGTDCCARKLQSAQN